MTTTYLGTGWIADKPDLRGWTPEKFYYLIKNPVFKAAIGWDTTNIDFQKAELQKFDSKSNTTKIKIFEDSTDNQKEFKEENLLILPINNKECKKKYPGSILELQKSVDLTPWCSQIQDQGLLKSCTAHTTVALLEYFEKRTSQDHIVFASRRFLYKLTRKLMHLEGDTGASLLNTLRVMAIFGVPPEEYWPYDISNFDEEPPAFCYAYAQIYKTIVYVRLDPPTISKENLLAQIKIFLAAGFPAMFGLRIYRSFPQVDILLANRLSLFSSPINRTLPYPPQAIPSDAEKRDSSKDIPKRDDPRGKIPFPTDTEKPVGGHALVAVGYDDECTITNSINQTTTKGAFLVRNSWGLGWGADGYGWLPYDYVLQGLAVDWFSIMKNAWVDIDTNDFGLVSLTDEMLGELHDSKDTDPGSH
jgi:C1A family cysteine protease